MKKNKYLKVNQIRRKRIFILSVLFISLLMINFSKNLNINQNFNDLENECSKNEDFLVENLKTKDLASDNSFSGIGAPWNVTHYANYTKSNLEVSFNNNSYDDTHAKIELYEWDGYQLNSTITNLYDTRNWINGTFHCGPDDNDDSRNDNDSNFVANWTFKTKDLGDTNYMSGNYFDESYSERGGSGGADCLELLIGNYNNYYYDVGDKCWWETVFEIDRDDIDEVWLSFSVFPKYGDQYNNHFVLQAIVNNKILWGNGLASMLEACGNPSTGQWYSPPTIFLNVNDEQLFPNGIKNMNITLEFKRVSGHTGSGYAEQYLVLIDNVSLIVKGEAKPSQLELQLNNENVNDNANYGEGNLGILGNWNGSLQSSVIANFSSNLYWPLKFEEDGSWISYKIELDANLNLFASKSTPETYYTVDPNIEYQGSSFIVSNNSKVNWTTYAHMEVPVGYEETNMTVEYPLDYNLTGVFFSLNPNSLSQTLIKEYGTKKVVNIPVSSITSNTNGFWRLKAVSPNYCIKMGIYNNATGSWESSSEFFSGDYINITAQINKSQLISEYIQQTKAQLQIRFPNGTIWDAENQLKQVNDIGMVYFDPIAISSDVPNYEVGNYHAIITWNNSYSSFNLNETGIIYKIFTVIHNSSLIPDEYYYADIYEGDTVNLKVTFYDPKNDKPIEDATIYLTHFTMGTQYFNEITPGYYLLIFNTTGGNAGENELTIYATHPSYQNNEINITIEVIHYTSLTADEYPSIEVPWNNNFTIHLNYTDISDDSGIESANPIVYWNGETSIKSGNGLYNITCNTSKYLVNTAPNLRIDFDKIGYESQTLIISIEIIERETYIYDIFINNADCTVNKSYNIHSGEIVNITVKYYDYDAGGSFIHAATVTLNGTNIGEIFTENNNFYNLTLNSTKLSAGISFLNIIAQKNNYTSVTELLTINVYERETNYWLYLNGTVQGKNPSIQLYKNQILNITLTYNDTLLKEHIPDAIVDINGSGISELLVESYNNYSILINSNDLNQGVNFLTIFARKDGYEAHSILLVIEIIQIETNLTLFLDGEDKTSNPSITRYPNEMLNITVSYDRSVPVSHIPGAIVDINGSGISELLTEAFNNYSVLIDTGDLNQGVNFLTIFARKSGYEPQTISLIIEIIQIETDLTLYIDGEDITSNPSITRYPNEMLNITVSYDRSVPLSHIPGAIVDINGSGISELLTEAYNNYSVLINTVDLNQGVNFLTIFARKGGFEPQTILLIIEIIQIETDLTLFLNGELKNDSATIQVEIDDTINITVYYWDNITLEHIPNAIVNLLGVGILDEIGNYYTITINASDLTQTITVFTIFAQANHYESYSIRFFVELVEKATTVQLFLNGEPKNDSATIQVEIDNTINVVIYFWDNETSEHIPNALVNLLGIGSLNEVSNYYTITINASDLEKTITAFTVFAQADHYESQSIRFFVELVEKATTLQLFLNGVNKTLDPVFDLTIGQNLNITVKYTDQFGALILNATVLLIGEDLLLDLMTDYAFQQYYIILNTNDLGIGVKLFSIIAQKSYFQSITKDSRITVNRILAEIRMLSGEAQIEAEIGDNVLLQIILNDTIFGADISGATVTYKWAYGQGEFLDSNNDGIFEILLENVPEGIHTITINAFATDEYDFRSYEITLVVIPPVENGGPDLSWLIYVLGGGIVGIVSIFTLYQKHFKYPPMVRKIRKLRKKIRKEKKVKPIMLNKREDIINENFKSQIQVLESKPIKTEKDFEVEPDSNIKKSDNLQNGGI